MGLFFVLYILDLVRRNFVRQVHTRIQKLFIRKVPLRFYAKSKFCVCFEIHIPVDNSKCLSSNDYMFGQGLRLLKNQEFEL